MADADGSGPGLEDRIFDDTVSRLRRCLALLNKHLEANATQVAKIAEDEDTEKRYIENGTITEMDVGLEGCCKETAVTDRANNENPSEQIIIVDYESELQMGDVMRLITKELSEPYSIYTYRYFIHNWPRLCLLALDTRSSRYVGAIVCKLDLSRHNRRRGYIAMLAVDESCRRLGIGTRLVRKAIKRMQEIGCDEVVLETEVTNLDAIRLYTNLGFIREKRLFRYYLNGVDAFRLKLFFAPEPEVVEAPELFMNSQEVSCDG